jgi:hypothetical protein
MGKKIISLLLILVMLLSSVSFADGETWLSTEETESIFSDVNQEDWFYEAVMTMNRYGIINGYPDGTFKPFDPVSREEFATIMVKALGLERKTTSSSFADVADGYWASDYIEAARPFLTAYLKSGEVYFKPQEDAVREDMAVALVRALEKDVESSMVSVLEDFIDSDNISPNLKEYMAGAVYHKLMSGYDEEDGKKLKPLATLTRAEAAALLLSVVKEEKIVFEDEEKVVMDDNEFILQQLDVDGGIKLSWDFKSDLAISGYKVVASKEDSTPIYDENGYVAYTENKNYTVYNNAKNNNSDFTSFEAGETYYVAITAIAGDEKIVSNTIEITMPEAVSNEGRTPKIVASQTDNGLLIEWDAIDTNGLKGYKVVASKYDSTPVYPDNGYAKWITNFNQRSHYINPGSLYYNGDFSEFKAGETYYVSVTAYYDNAKIAGNTVQVTMPGEKQPEATTAEKTPQVTVEVKDGRLVVNWGEISKDGLNGYKIVASKSNPNPVYPTDGYAYWITNLTTLSKDIYPGTNYNNGEFSKFESGETYYISVTAVYNNEKIKGNAVQVTMP